jgi:hypothetical protein
VTADGLIRVWKDPDSRDGASTSDHPAGDIVLESPGGVGAASTEYYFTNGCGCGEATVDICTLPGIGCPSTWFGTCNVGGGWTIGCCP